MIVNASCADRVTKSKMFVHFYWEFFGVILWISVCLNFVNCSPTFGDEFVHIKVHLPKEGGSHGPSIHSHSIGHHGQVVTSPKVIHHFHKRRRPSKKSPFGKHSGLLESILLSEIKQPISSDHYKYLNHAEDIAKHVDTYIVKPEKPKVHVDTYTVLEETKPKETVETYEVIESKVPQHHHHHTDSLSYSDFHDDEYHYKPKSKPHVDTYEVIDNLFDDFHSHVKQHGHAYGISSPKKQRVKTVNIVDSHENDYDHSHYGNDEHDYGVPDDSGSSDGYHYGSKSHADTVKIVDSQTPHHHTHEYSINFDKRPHSESVEIVKSSSGAKPNSYYRRHKPKKSSSPGYHYEQPSYSGSTSYEGGNDFRQHKYQNTYKTIPEEHYVQEPDQYAPEDTYLPPSRQNNKYHNHYSHGVRQNSLNDNEGLSSSGSISGPNDSYLPPPLPTLPEHQEANTGSTSGGQWTAYDSAYKATETYSGIDSYSAGHVQGFGSGGYKYPSSYL